MGNRYHEPPEDGGLTRRDQFALNAVLPDGLRQEYIRVAIEEVGNDPSLVPVIVFAMEAKSRYQFADAMEAERNGDS